MIFKNFKLKLDSFKDRLTQINEKEYLSKMSFIVILFLDIFVLSIIFSGLTDHTNQLTTPDEYIPYQCQNIILEESWKEENRLDMLESDVLYNYRDTQMDTEYFNKDKIVTIHPICNKIVEELKNLQANNDIILLFRQRESLKNKKSSIESEINSIKGSYDTLLLEKIANQPESESITNLNANNIKNNIDNKRKELDSVLNQLKDLESKINNSKSIQSFFTEIEGNNKENIEKLRNDYRSTNFWYPVKKFGMELIFLLPIFIVIYFWNDRSLKKNSGLQILISSHLIVVSFIPIFFKLIEAVVDIIPKRLFITIWNFLESLHIIAIWHYTIIILAIFLALGTIYIIQKKFFNRKRLLERRLIKGACIECGKKLPSESKACPMCGTNQLKKCPSCKKDTYAVSDYCRECGQTQNNEIES